VPQMSAEGQPVACGQVLKRPLAVSITWRPGRGWMEPAAGGAAWLASTWNASRHTLLSAPIWVSVQPSQLTRRS
jgi:hypothetical protein